MDDAEDVKEPQIPPEPLEMLANSELKLSFYGTKISALRIAKRPPRPGIEHYILGPADDGAALLWEDKWPTPEGITHSDKKFALPGKEGVQAWFGRGGIRTIIDIYQTKQEMPSQPAAPYKLVDWNSYSRRRYWVEAKNNMPH